jgi:hypothetical protein
VEAISTYALVEECVGQCEGLCHLRNGPVKGGIKTGDLRQIRVDGHSHSDGRDIVRFVQGRQRHQRLEFGQEFPSDARRTGVPEPAMHDAMAERGEVSVAQPVPNPGQNRGQNLARYARRCASQSGGAMASPSTPTAVAAGCDPMPSTRPPRMRRSPW